MPTVDAEMVTVPLVLRNVRSKTVTLVLEPWGEEHSLEPGSEIRLVFSGPPGDSPLVEWSEDCVTAYGWSGSTFRLFRDGIEL